MNRLRELRKERNLTLRELAVKVNISYSNIAMLEREERNFTADTIKIFADFFNVSSDYLLGLSDNRTNVAITTYDDRLDDTVIAILNDLKQLNDSQKQDVIKIIKFLKVQGDL